jgi:hypothetical protein
LIIRVIANQEKMFGLNLFKREVSLPLPCFKT